ncbi:MAG TPA: restriction endonuclease [Herminiimonas sp.]|nr:restriction endonuclease [Herminiimonas sp.]
MKFKMNKNSIFAILLRSPWWVSSAVALVILTVAWVALPLQYKLFGMLISGPFWAISAVAGWKKFRAPNPEYIEHRLQLFRSMPWQDFSAGVEQALLRDGFVVTRIDRPEVDFFIASAERKGLVSCKRWKVPTNGIEPLRDLHQAMLAQDGHECIYVTTGSFTQNAMQFAVDKKIRLLHGIALVQFLRELKAPDKKKK